MNLPLCYRTLDSIDSTNYAVIGKFHDEIKFNNAGGVNTMVLVDENIEEVTDSLTDTLLLLALILTYLWIGK